MFFIFNNIEDIIVIADETNLSSGSKHLRDDVLLCETLMIPAKLKKK